MDTDIQLAYDIALIDAMKDRFLAEIYLLLAWLSEDTARLETPG